MARAVRWPLLAAVLAALMASSAVFAALGTAPLKVPKLKMRWKLLTRMHFVRQCDEPAIMDCPDMAFRSNKDGDLFYNTSCVVSRLVSDVTEAVLKLTRCRDAKSYNTCEYYRTFRWGVGLCQLMQLPSMPGAGFWSKWKPHISCPLNPGNYTLTEYKVSLSEMSVIDWPGYVWIGSSILRAENRSLLSCKDFEFEVHRIRDTG